MRRIREFSECGAKAVAGIDMHLQTRRPKQRDSDKITKGGLTLAVSAPLAASTGL